MKVRWQRGGESTCFGSAHYRSYGTAFRDITNEVMRIKIFAVQRNE